MLRKELMKGPKALEVVVMSEGAVVSPGKWLKPWWERWWFPVRMIRERVAVWADKTVLRKGKILKKGGMI